MRVFVLIALIIALSFADMRAAPSKNGPRLDRLIEDILKNGADDDLGANTARDMGFASNVTTKVLSHEYAESVDGRRRSADAVIEKDAETGGVKATAVILMSKKKEGSASESFHFRLSPSGAVEKAYRLTGKYDAEGKAIKGSGIVVDMDPDDAKRLLKKELDFWLKGVGLKKTAAAKK